MLWSGCAKLFGPNIYHIYQTLSIRRISLRLLANHMLYLKCLAWKMFHTRVNFTLILCHLLSLQWRHNEHDADSNHRRFNCLLNHLFRRRSKIAWNLRVTGPREGNSPVAIEFPAQWARDAENISIWWRHHGKAIFPAIWIYKNKPIDEIRWWMSTGSQSLYISSLFSAFRRRNGTLFWPVAK